MKPSEEVHAEDLCHRHIDLLIAFDHRFPSSGVKAFIQGELRQVYATSHSVVINLAAPDREPTDVEEFELEPGAPVAISGKS
jgi:hypothetical protein